MAGIFGLGEVRTEQVNNTWPEDPNFGYFAGGADPGIQFCTIERLDFSNETVSSPGNYQLTRPRRYLAAVSNNSYGYFGGGNESPNSCIIDRLDFSNETVGLPGNNFDSTRSEHAGVSSPDYGYFKGSTYSSIINRLNFESETLTLLTAKLTQGRRNMSTVSSSNYGYFGCGEVPALPREQCTIDRLDFSNETVSGPLSHGMNLSEARALVGTVSGSDYGYFAGGRISPPTTYFNTIDRLDFSSETMSLPGNNLTPSRGFIAGVSNSNYGYLGAGGLPMSNIIDRLDFFTETTSVSPATLIQARYGSTAVPSGTSGTTIRHLPKTTGTDIDGKPISNTYGYFGGGFAPPRVVTIDRLDFSSETVAAPGDYQLSQARNSISAVFSSNYGYFAGGFTPPRVNTIDRLDFSSETMALPGNNLNDGRNLMAGVSNSNYGYIGGGFIDPVPGRTCTIERLDFSNETVAAPGTYQLTEAREELTAVSNSKMGAYFAGGQTPSSPGTVSTIDRLDFYTETTSNPPANLSSAREDMIGISNSDYGYFAGGDIGPAVSTIDRLDFSNDTVEPDINYLPQGRYELAAVSNNSYAYFGGGRLPGFQNTIDRLDFSNDTLDLSTNNLTQARAGLAAVSN